MFFSKTNRRPTEPQFYVGLDLGTTRFRCLAMERAPDGRILSTHYREEEVDWFSGKLPDWKVFRKGIKKIAAKFRSDGIKLVSACVNVPHDSIASTHIPVEDKRTIIQDIRKEEAASKGSTVLQIVDDSDSLAGDRMIPEDTLIRKDDIAVTCSGQFINHLRHNLLRCGIISEDMCSTGYSLRYTVSAMKNDEHTLIIDIGARFTDIAVFRGRLPLMIKSFAAGGNDITAAIASTMNITGKDAERVKTARRNYFTLQITPARVWSPGPAEIIQREMEAVYRIIKAQVLKSGLEMDALNQIILCGGTSRFSGIDLFLKKQFQTDAWTLSFSDAEQFSTCTFDCSHACVIGLAFHSFMIRNPS